MSLQVLSRPVLAVSRFVTLALSGKQKACISTLECFHVLIHSTMLLLPLSHLRLYLVLFLMTLKYKEGEA